MELGYFYLNQYEFSDIIKLIRGQVFYSLFEKSAPPKNGGGGLLINMCSMGRCSSNASIYQDRCSLNILFSFINVCVPCTTILNIYCPWSCHIGSFVIFTLTITIWK